MFKKILIADDHAVVRMGISLALEAENNSIQLDFAESYFDIENILSRKAIELLVLDIQMPGVEKSVIKQIKQMCPSIKILLFSAHHGDVILQYLREGADGYLSKQCNSKQIMDSIKIMYETGIVFPPETMREMIRSSDRLVPEQILSAREYEIYTLLVKGMGNLEITNLLSLKAGTVSTYRKRIFSKLKVSNLADVIKIHMNLNRF